MSFKTFTLGCYRVKLRQTKDSYFVNILGNEWETAPNRHRREEKRSYSVKIGELHVVAGAAF